MGKLTRNEINSLEKRQVEIKNEISAILDKCEEEKRNQNEDEQRSIDNGMAEIRRIETQLKLATIEERAQGEQDKNKQLRSFLRSASSRERSGAGLDYEIRAADPIQSPAVSAAVPLVIRDLIQPLEEDSILSALGISIQHGVHGNIRYPILSKTVEMKFANEGVELDDQKIDFDKLDVTKNRAGISVCISNQAINDPDVDLIALIRSQFTKAEDVFFTKWIFGNKTITSSVKSVMNPANMNSGHKLAHTNGKFFREQAIDLEAPLRNAKVICNTGNIGYVVNQKMLCELKKQPLYTGSDRDLLTFDNGRYMMNGYPVFETGHIGDNTIEFGAFGSYVVPAQHGTMRMVVDPYTRASFDEVKLVFNTEYSLTVLRKEAFAMSIGTPEKA